MKKLIFLSFFCVLIFMVFHFSSCLFSKEEDNCPAGKELRSECNPEAGVTKVIGWTDFKGEQFCKMTSSFDIMGQKMEIVLYYQFDESGKFKKGWYVQDNKETEITQGGEQSKIEVNGSDKEDCSTTSSSLSSMGTTSGTNSLTSGGNQFSTTYTGLPTNSTDLNSWLSNISNGSFDTITGLPNHVYSNTDTTSSLYQPSATTSGDTLNGYCTGFDGECIEFLNASDYEVYSCTPPSAKVGHCDKSLQKDGGYCKREGSNGGEIRTIGVLKNSCYDTWIDNP